VSLDISQFGVDSGSAYASYQAGAAEVFVELAITTSVLNAHATLETACGEVDGTPIGSDPKYLGVSDSGGAFFAWTRGAYYFSAHAKGGDAELDTFMRAFPF